MIWRLLILAGAVAIVSGAIFIAACGDDGDQPDSGDTTTRPEQTASSGDGDGDDDGDSDDLSQHEDELRETVPAAFTAIFAGGGVEAYSFASNDFKEKCSLEDFIGVIAFVKIFLGDLEEADIVVTVKDIRYEGGRAYVTAEGTIMDEPIEPEDDDSLSQFWVREDGEWKWGTDDAEPCKTDSVFESGSDTTPASGPGSSRAEPVPLGSSLDIGDSRVTVLEADLNAAARLEELLEFEATPVPGRKVVVVRIRVEHIGEDGDSTVSVYESNYKVTGSANIVYDSFDNDTSCGFLSDSLDSELFPGGSTEGYVCFQVPAEESNLLLISDEGFSEDRRFFALE